MCVCIREHLKGSNPSADTRATYYNRPSASENIQTNTYFIPISFSLSSPCPLFPEYIKM